MFGILPNYILKKSLFPIKPEVMPFIWLLPHIMEWISWYHGILATF